MRQGEPWRRILGSVSLVALIAAVSLGVALTSGRAGAQTKAATYSRAQSLITYGTEWGPYGSFNPYFDSYATGTVGLCYETLLRYDPLKDEYIAWLARSARFTGPKTYTVVVRRGIRWSNGQKFTGKDVRFNFRLGRFSSAFWHDLYSTLAAIKVRGLTVAFEFKTTPNYIQWQHLVWNLPMINPAQGAKISNKTLTAYNPKNPIGTGPYELDRAGYDPRIRVVWKKKAVWWAAKQKIAPSPAPRYVIDLRLGTVGDDCMSGCIYTPNQLEDLSNVYVPTIERYVAGGRSKTYYSNAPYHLSTSTLWLVPNTTHKPLGDPAFRAALATAINVENIVRNDYERLVLRADPTGLLPAWKSWIDKKLVDLKGFSFSTERARAMLAAAGYRDVNGDGYVENRDGSPLVLKTLVPMGWSDWETAQMMIIASAKKAGINLARETCDRNYSGSTCEYWEYVKARNSGSFDLVIDYGAQLGDSPWSYFDRVFRLPVRSTQTEANFERYANPTAWKLVQRLDRTPPAKVKQRQAIASRLERIFLNKLPVIPLWYGGLWAQWQSNNWTNWPSSKSKRNYVPSMWRGYMQMTGIDMITHLKKAD